MKKIYSKFQTPSLVQARKRLTKQTNVYTYDLATEYHNIGVAKTYLIKTYGCQGNLADSEKMSGILEQLGFSKALSENDADIVLFNTCAIRENAENRLFGELGRIKRIKKIRPDMIIGLCGCMMQEEKITTLIKNKYNHVDIVFGTHNITKLPQYLADVITHQHAVMEVFSVEGSVYEDIPTIRDHPFKAWVNIMYGCDEFCTYCIVPYTRGKERSRHPNKIISEVEQLVRNGYQEVTLLGQNVNAYGKDFTEFKYGFADLLVALAQTNINRIRYTTSHPRDLDDDTIEVMGKYHNIMPHLHLPVQSGSNSVLKKMNRKYSREEYLDKIEKLKTSVPGISITTDIIVAFPSEGDDDFAETKTLVEKVGFEGAYTFIFSPRFGTPAFNYPNEISEEKKKERLNELNALINKYTLIGSKRFEKEVVEVLVDGSSKSNKMMLTGYTKHNKLVNFEGTKDLIGQLVMVEITKAYTWHLLGELKKSDII